MKVLAVRVEDVDMGGLRELGDQLKEKLGEGVVVIASAAGGKVSLMATATAVSYTHLDVYKRQRCFRKRWNVR